jgi:hypothetical protein
MRIQKSIKRKKLGIILLCYPETAFSAENWEVFSAVPRLTTTTNRPFIQNLGAFNAYEILQLKSKF